MASKTTQYPPDVHITGRLTRDPVLRTTKSGKSVSTIRVAVNPPEGDATFHDVVCWNKTAEAVCQYLRKGRLVEVQGPQSERVWTDRDGNERRTDEISAYRVQFVSGQKTASDRELA